nr:uncharacterized protein LOC122273247 [Parasteatoda tepidariorum]
MSWVMFCQISCALLLMSWVLASWSGMQKFFQSLVLAYFVHSFGLEDSVESLVGSLMVGFGLEYSVESLVGSLMMGFGLESSFESLESSVDSFVPLFFWALLLCLGLNLNMSYYWNFLISVGLVFFWAVLPDSSVVNIPDSYLSLVRPWVKDSSLMRLIRPWVKNLKAWLVDLKRNCCRAHQCFHSTTTIKKRSDNFKTVSLILFLFYIFSFILSVL